MKKYYSFILVFIALVNLQLLTNAQETLIMPVSGTEEFTTCSGVLFDAGGENDYPDNMDSAVLLTGDDSNYPTITFTEFNFEQNFDYLRIYDGDDNSGVLLGEFTGDLTSNLPLAGEEVLSFTGAFYIETTSDFIEARSGFSADIGCYSPILPPLISFTPEAFSIFSYFTTCDGTVQFTDNSYYDPTEWTWDFGDGNTSNEQNPSHTYQTEGSYTVELTACNQYGCSTVIKENIILFDSTNATCTQYNMPQTGIEVITDCSGTLYDSGGATGFYLPEEDGITIIDAGEGTEIELIFAEFTLAEFGTDYVEIYDGSFPNVTLLGAFNVQNPPTESLFATSGAMSVVFNSNIFSSGQGFTAYWNVINEIEPPIADLILPSSSIPFNTAVQFIDNSENNTNTWEWIFSNGLILTEQNPSIAFNQAGDYTVTLNVSNCSGASSTEAISFTVQSPPQLVQNDNDDYDFTLCDNDAPFTFELEAGQDTSLNFSIGNFPIDGLGSLSYNVEGIADAVAGFTQVLVYDWGLRNEITYTKPIDRIKLSVPNINVEDINTTDPVKLELELEGKQIFLVLAHQSDLDEDIFSEFKEVLNNFVNDGGTVVFLGQSNENLTDDPEIIFNSGLIDGEYFGDDFDGPTVTVQNPNHPILEGLPNSFESKTSTTLYQVNNPDAETLLSYLEYDMVSVRENIGDGDGNVVFVGFNYAQANEPMLQMLTNIIKWGSKITNVQWLEATPENGIVNAGTFEDITLNINTQGVPDGTYTYNVSVSTNDIDNPFCITPISITVNGRPEIEVSTDTLNFGDVIVTTEESLILTIANTGQDTLFINDILLNNDAFSVNETNFFVLPGITQSILITYSPTEIESIEGLVMTILSNDLDNPETEIIINAEGVGAPIIVPNPTPVEITLNVGEQGTANLDIGNTGLSDLEFCIENQIDVNAGFLLSFTTDFFATEFSWELIDVDGNVIMNAEAGTYQDGETQYDIILLEGLDPTQTYILNFYDTNGDGSFSEPYTITDILTNEIVVTGDFSGNEDAELSVSLPNYSTWLTLSGDDCNISVFPNGNSSYELSFDATNLIGGHYFATVTVSSNDPANPSIQIPVILNVIGIPEIAVEADETLDFGSILIGNTNDIDITISNTGTDTLFIDDFATAFGDAFEVSPPDFYLLVGETETATITFVPSEILDYSGVLTIENNDTPFTINVIAVGQGSPSTSLDVAGIETTLEAGNCETFEITVSNNGEGVLEYEVLAGKSGFKFDFTIASFPFEFSWELIDNNTGEVVESTQAGDYTESVDYSIEFTGLSTTKTYSLRLLDSFGDGALSNYTVSDLFSGALIIEGDFLTGSLEEHFIGTPVAPQLSITPNSGTIDFPDEQTFEIEICAEDLLADVYNFDININTNEPNNSPLAIPVTMNVIAFPQADFTADNDELVCGIGVEVQFIDNTINTPTEWLWSFGDGNTSTEQNPVYIYELSGTYDVSLVVTNILGSDTINYENFVEVDLNCLDESVPNTGENTVIGCNGTITDSGGDIFYNNNSNGTMVIHSPGASAITLNFISFDYEVFDTLFIYDGPDANSTLIGAFNNNNPIAIGQSFTSSGEYLTLVEETNDITGAGYTGFEATFACEAPEVAPVPNFTYEAVLPCSGEIQFTSTSENFPNQWQWNFGDGETSEQTNPIHTYTESGEYEVRLFVSNQFGADFIKLPVIVNVLSVDAVIPQQVEAGEQIQFEGINSGVIWNWDFGDGATSTFANPTHTYESNGTYEVTVNITDFAVSTNCVGTLTQTVQVGPPTAVEELGNAAWNIFPNPAENYVNLVIDNSITDNILIELSDISGRVMFSKKAVVNKQYETQIPLNNLAKGLYLVTLTDGKNRSTQTVIKQ